MIIKEGERESQNQIQLLHECWSYSQYKLNWNAMCIDQLRFSSSTYFCPISGWLNYRLHMTSQLKDPAKLEAFFPYPLPFPAPASLPSCYFQAILFSPLCGELRRWPSTVIQFQVPDRGRHKYPMPCYGLMPAFASLQ